MAIFSRKPWQDTDKVLWFDDDCFREEYKVLERAGVAVSWHEIDLRKNNKQLKKR